MLGLSGCRGKISSGQLVLPHSRPDLLLCALSDSAPICDIEMERFLTMARHAMLETASRIMASDGEVDPA